MTTDARLIDPKATLRDIRRVILLAGRVGRHGFAESVGRSVLDLPADSSSTLLDVWARRLSELGVELGRRRLHVQIAVERDGVAPNVSRIPSSVGVDFEIVRDASEYRGTAGVVKDLSKDWLDGDRVVVATANQIQREPLAPLLSDVGSATGVSLVPYGANEFASLFVLRRDLLGDVPGVGFVDLKEQALRAAGARSIRVTRRPLGASFPVRTLGEYITALRLNCPGSEDRRTGSAATWAFAECWQPTFAIVEPGATVAEGALVQDSVVLEGGVVEPGAVVARSVVCPGGIVLRDRAAVEQVVVRD